MQVWQEVGFDGMAPASLALIFTVIRLPSLLFSPLKELPIIFSRSIPKIWDMLLYSAGVMSIAWKLELCVPSVFLSCAKASAADLIGMLAGYTFEPIWTWVSNSRSPFYTPGAPESPIGCQKVLNCFSWALLMLPSRDMKMALSLLAALLMLIAKSQFVTT